MRRVLAFSGALLVLVLAGCGTPDADVGGPALPSRMAGLTATPPAPKAPDRQVAWPVRGPHLGARIIRRTVLRRSPGGPAVVTIGRATRFGGKQVVAIVARRGDWLAVLHQWMPNGRAGWIPADAARIIPRRWSIEVDRSARSALVRRDGRALFRFPVGVGRAGSRTPLGRYSITDRLLTPPGSAYGCCILALSGRQLRLPSGWMGGNRLALHGAPEHRIGAAGSAGCLNVRDRDMRRLMRRIPAGTRVTIVP